MSRHPSEYEGAARVLLRETGCTIRKWRGRNTGTAYTRSDDWGIEVPRPRGPVSFAVFCHEVGHQLLHRHGAKPRWLEEVEAWEYALAQFDRFGLGGLAEAQQAGARSLVWAAVKAMRRGADPAAIRERMPAWVEENWWTVDRTGIEEEVARYASS